MKTRRIVGLLIALFLLQPERPGDPDAQAQQFGPSYSGEQLGAADSSSAEIDVDSPGGGWPEGDWDHAAAGKSMTLQPTAGCCEICGAGYDCPHLWTWYNGAKILNRSRPRAKSVTQDILGNSLLDIEGLNDDIAGGYETKVTYYLGRDKENRDEFLEFVYWGLNEWSESQSVSGTRTNYTSDAGDFTAGSLFSPFALTDFNFADWQQAEYHSEINNFELNWWFRPRHRPDRLALLPNGRWQRQCQTGTFWSFLLGLRGLSLDEGFTLDSRGTRVDAGATTTLWGRQSIWSQSDTFGIQVGAEVVFRRHRFDWGARIKAAPMLNWAEQTTRMDLLNDLSPILRYADDTDAAFMGEVNLFASYQILPRVTVFGGYDLMWLEGVALAAEQTDFGLSAPAQVNDNGGIFFQGVSLGGQVVW
ncbi:MAG: hypothetical protein GYA33_08725 [Thermogutta sp.]|nr:hypothetical protein [Thermogutta sp.]